MDLKNMKKCDSCGDIYDASQFVNMRSNGELVYSKIEIYGDEYDLCPKCTKKIYDVLYKDTKSELFPYLIKYTELINGTSITTKYLTFGTDKYDALDKWRKDNKFKFIPQLTKIVDINKEKITKISVDQRDKNEVFLLNLPTKMYSILYKIDVGRGKEIKHAVINATDDQDAIDKLYNYYYAIWKREDIIVSIEKVTFIDGGCLYAIDY